jgi:multidrug efflux pump subunit AcrA (membrane-fusion protein)
MVYASAIVKGQKEAIVKANGTGVINSIDFELGQFIEKGDDFPL